MTQKIKQPPECRILVVDDEAAFCRLICSTLEPLYRVNSCLSGKEACTLIEQNDFDVVVTDLRLKDISGLDVLHAAKKKDPYIEVMLITGYASFESMSKALDLGAISYIEKPVQIKDFLARIEKAVASRLFHLKSLMLMQRSGRMSAEDKDHLSDITALYYFTRKVTVSLEVAEIMRITLDEICRSTGVPFCAVGISARGFREIHAMVAQGETPPDQAAALLLRHSEEVFPFFEKKHLENKTVPLFVYKRKSGVPPAIEKTFPVAIPLIVTGTTIGTMAVFSSKKDEVGMGALHFLNIVSSIVSPIIENGCSVRQVRQLAKTDTLTGIGNRRSFYEALYHEIARANRKKAVFSLIIIDIDDFKVINDTCGHLAGDAVLRDLVTRVSTCIRAVDEFSRYGGEEFAVVLPETGVEGAEVVARRIKHAVNAKNCLYEKKEIHYTVSMGIATYSGKHPAKEQVLINQADEAMYSAKRDGKNRIAVCPACV